VVAQEEVLQQDELIALVLCLVSHLYVLQPHAQLLVLAFGLVVDLGLRGQVDHSKVPRQERLETVVGAAVVSGCEVIVKLFLLLDVAFEYHLGV
jgi:hypothetical protein